MPVVITGTIFVEKSYDGVEVEDAIEEFYEEYGIDPETIDGKGFVGTCDGCNAVILSNEPYSESDEDEIRCEACIDKYQQELAQNAAEEAEESPQSQEEPQELFDSAVYEEQSSEPSCDCQHDRPDGSPDPSCHCIEMRSSSAPCALVADSEDPEDL